MPNEFFVREPGVSPGFFYLIFFGYQSVSWKFLINIIQGINNH